ncbi:MAG: DUF748 domain-containing protein [Candidatus Omnitrophica bacterium]|nr:DUF748 domain-containing protein [Candidatus Omnitrophota bacterium]MDD5670485.1 DUF748 domain-containing protein [Candidatus Omnitrophota bacterium]
MKIAKIVLLILVLLTAAYFVFAGRLVGAYLEPVLEKKLTEIFGLEVEIKDLKAHPFPGFASATHMVFHNRPQFDTRPHFDIPGISFDIRYPDLLDKHVNIGHAVFKRPVYLIETVSTPDGSLNNITDWVRHIDAWNGEDDEPAAGEGQPASSAAPPPKRWQVDIRKIELRDGTLIISDRSGKGAARNFVFKRIDGALTGFRWPAGNPPRLDQRVALRGVCGEKVRAPFWAGGKANFATGNVSFDLRGDIHNGSLQDYSFLWEGLPVEIVDGRFDLKAHVVCNMRKLESQNVLVMKDLKIRPVSGPVQMIWGIPFQGWLAFLQNQKTLTLEIPVEGDITDPDFRFYKAFQDAFQDALQRYVLQGINLFTKTASTAVKLAEGTPGVVFKTPAKVVEGLGKITTAVTDNDLIANLKPLKEGEKP